MLTLETDALGSAAFSPVKSDMLGNVKVRISPSPPTTQSSRLGTTNWYPDLQKIREQFLAAPADSRTIQDLVRNELKSKSHKATEGLVWLVR